MGLMQEANACWGALGDDEPGWIDPPTAGRPNAAAASIQRCGSYMDARPQRMHCFRAALSCGRGFVGFRRGAAARRVTTLLRPGSTGGASLL
jgi:hypothetical protein